MSYGIVRPPIATPLYHKEGLGGLGVRFGQFARTAGKAGRRSSEGFQGPVALPSRVGTSRDMAQVMSFSRPRLAICRKIVKREPIDMGES